MIDCNITTKYLFERQRMTKQQADGTCRIKCANCPLSKQNNDMDISCLSFETLYPEKTVAIVQKWSNEHPQKTYLTELLKIFPDTPLKDDGTPDSICPYELGLMYINDCRKGRKCIECWYRPFGE